MIVSGITEADIASQIPPGKADDPSRRQTELNVPIIRPMKKILTTLTVIAATALGAQGQTTNTFYYGGTNSFTGMTFSPGTNNLPDGELYDQARLIFRSTNVVYNGGNILISGITLSGDGITGTLTGFGDVVLTNNSATVFRASAFVPLTTDIGTWFPANNSSGFTVTFRGGAIAPESQAQLFYRLTYANESGDQLNTSFGNVGLTVVPEPSAYAAAAGLLALFLWSSRRHLFKLAGARSAASGNGAA